MAATEEWAEFPLNQRTILGTFRNDLEACGQRGFDNLECLKVTNEFSELPPP